MLELLKDSDLSVEADLMLSELLHQFMSVASCLNMATFASYNSTTLLAVVNGKSFAASLDHFSAVNDSQPVNDAMSSFSPTKNDLGELLCLVTLRLDLDISSDLEMLLSVGAGAEWALRLNL